VVYPEVKEARDMQTFWDLMAWRAERSPDALAVRDDRGVKLSYAELCIESETLAARLMERGVQPGVTVSWVLPSRVETFVLMGALARLGAIQNPIVPIYGDDEIEFITSQVGARLLVTPGRFRSIDFDAMGRRVASWVGFEVVRIDELRRDPSFGAPASLDLPPPADPDAPRWVFATSGTTASPKCVKHSDRTIVASGNAIKRIGFRYGAKWGGAVPVAHIGGPTILAAALLEGAAMHVVEIFDPVKTCQQLRDWDCDMVAGVGALVNAMFEFQKGREDPAFPTLRSIGAGGGPKPPRLLERVQAELGCDLVPSYGMTECPYAAVSTGEDPIEARARGEGSPPPGVSLRIVDETERTLGRGEEGEIRVRGPQMFLGYVDSSLDADAVDSDGYFKTGDLGYLHPEGYLVVTGRLKELIVRNGENLSVRPIEDLLLQHPAVADATVVGLPHPVTGECVCAVVVARDGQGRLSLDDVRAYCKERGLMRQKWPERLELIDAIPRNPMGKAIKPELRRRFTSDAG
jgi:acyl-CoA synthetase (AMP-forming)/AMP-acid ligase II